MLRMIVVYAAIGYLGIWIMRLGLSGRYLPLGSPDFALAIVVALAGLFVALFALQMILFEIVDRFGARN